MEVEGRGLSQCQDTVLQVENIPPESIDGGEEEEEVVVEVEEEMVKEVMRWLEQEISGAAMAPGAGPAAAFGRDKGGSEESCGPTFSDSASTVMANVDTRGAAGVSYFWPSYPAEGDGGGRWDVAAEPMAAAVAAGDMQADGEEDEAEWLARVLNGAELELDDSGLLSF